MRASLSRGECASSGSPGDSRKFVGRVTAVRIGPKFARAHFNLGNLFMAQGKCAEARKHHDGGVRLKPDEPELADRLA